jgi:hypothetical protein
MSSIIPEPVFRMGGPATRPPELRYIGTDRNRWEQPWARTATIVTNRCRHSVRRVAGRNRRVACATRTNAGFHLQTAPAVTDSFTNILVATSPYTNATTSAQQFFRLIGD